MKTIADFMKENEKWYLNSYCEYDTLEKLFLKSDICEQCGNISGTITHVRFNDLITEELDRLVESFLWEKQGRELDDWENYQIQISNENGKFYSEKFNTDDLAKKMCKDEKFLDELEIQVIVENERYEVRHQDISKEVLEKAIRKHLKNK